MRPQSGSAGQGSARSPRPNQTHTRPLLVALALVVSTAGIATATGACGSPNPRAGSQPTSAQPAATATTPATPPVPQASTTAPTTTGTTGTPSPLTQGDHGPAVLALQERLASLGYWLGRADGTFGTTTRQAVYALQKVAGITADGVVGPATTAALARSPRPTPRSSQGHVIEVDLGADLVLVVNNGTLQAVLNTSTGGGYGYTDQGVTSMATTPTGHFEVYRQVDAMVTNTLGELWRPKFFVGGFAIHGASSVPPQPVSHGCVRLSDQAMDWIWSANLAPIGTPVWVY